jgi:hypothetical protein
VAAGDGKWDVGGYMLGEMGPWRSERSRWRFGTLCLLSGIAKGCVGARSFDAGSGGRERSECDEFSRGLNCGRGLGLGLSTGRFKFLCFLRSSEAAGRSAGSSGATASLWAGTVESLCVGKIASLCAKSQTGKLKEMKIIIPNCTNPPCTFPH